MFKATYNPNYREAPPLKMVGYTIYCFDCKRNNLVKSELSRSHKGHNVEWVNHKLERFNG